VLRELRERGFLLGVVTNGRTVIQRPKIETLGILPLLDSVVISEEAGPAQAAMQRLSRAPCGTCSAPALTPGSSAITPETTFSVPRRSADADLAAGHSSVACGRFAAGAPHRDPVRAAAADRSAPQGGHGDRPPTLERDGQRRDQCRCSVGSALSGRAGGVCRAFPRAFLSAYVWCDKVRPAAIASVPRRSATAHDLQVYILPPIIRRHCTKACGRRREAS